eukprot:gene4681-7182_t
MIERLEASQTQARNFIVVLQQMQRMKLENYADEVGLHAACQTYLRGDKARTPTRYATIDSFPDSPTARTPLSIAATRVSFPEEPPADTQDADNSWRASICSSLSSYTERLSQLEEKHRTSKLIPMASPLVLPAKLRRKARGSADPASPRSPVHQFSPGNPHAAPARSIEDGFDRTESPASVSSDNAALAFSAQLFNDLDDASYKLVVTDSQDAATVAALKKAKRVSWNPEEDVKYFTPVLRPRFPRLGGQACKAAA